MSEAGRYIAMLEKSGVVERGRIQKLAAAAFKLEIGEKAVRPLEAVKELVGIKKPVHERVLQYIQEGVEQAKPRAGLAAVGIAGALGVAGLVKAFNEIKFRAAMADLSKDPEIQADPARAKSIAAMVKRWAPSVASDPQILKGTVKNLMKFPDSYLTYDVAKKLSEAEAQYAATHGLLSLVRQRVL
jgi:hypothetical protein